MKNAVKFILVVLFVFIGVNAIGQSVLVKGGLSLAKISFVDSGDEVYYKGAKPKVGFHLGISYEKKISDMFFFEFGPMLHLKGDIERGNYSDKTNVLYLDIPILVKGDFELNDEISIYNTFGPYLGFGIWGRKSDMNVGWGSNSGDDFERLDFGLSLGLGVDFKDIQFGLAYDFSLLNNASNSSWGESYKHKVIRLSLGYRFRE